MRVQFCLLGLLVTACAANPSDPIVGASSMGGSPSGGRSQSGDSNGGGSGASAAPGSGSSQSGRATLGPSDSASGSGSAAGSGASSDPGSGSGAGAASGSSAGPPGTGGPGGLYPCPVPTGTPFVVSTGQDLQNAMRNAMPGDLILVAPGSYTAPGITVPVHSNGGSAVVTFEGKNAGTMAAPITVAAQDPSHPPILKGQGNVTTVASGGYTVHISGPYWKVQNLIITDGQKGIILDGSSNSYLCGLEVFGTGDEAIHIRDGSSYCVVEGVHPHDTGLAQPDYSEGFYVGSFSNSPSFDPACHDNIIKKSLLGPNIKSKYVNFQPGSSHNTVDGCDFDGTGAQGANSGYCFVSNKGSGSVIKNSTFHRNGNGNITQDVADVLGGSSTQSNNKSFP